MNMVWGPCMINAWPGCRKDEDRIDGKIGAMNNQQAVNAGSEYKGYHFVWLFLNITG